MTTIRGTLYKDLEELVYDLESKSKVLHAPRVVDALPRPGNLIVGSIVYNEDDGGLNWWTGSKLVNHATKIGTLADDATPSVKGRRLWKTGGTTGITMFDDGVTGQEIIVRADHSVTITHDVTKIALDQSTPGNYAMTDTDTLHLALYDDGVWYEISRSINT